jgi:flagellar protein FlaF
MYQFPYAEVLDDAPKAARERERKALEHSIVLLEAAAAKGAASREAVDALAYVRRIWSVLVEDLATAENDLPQPLRADLISIGLWVMREAENIRQGKTHSFADLIEVSRSICEGLQ